MANNLNKIVNGKISFSTKGTDDIIDLTRRIEEELNKTGLKEGLATIFVQGSTGAVTTIEYEPGLLKDLPQFYEKIIPKNKSYAHDETWGDANGYSHLRASLQGPSLSVPFAGQKLLLGTWQQIVFLEFDNRPRQRNVAVQFIGC